MPSKPPAITKARRLAQIPELLQRKPRTTKELADYFEVPQRTIQRDLQALRLDGQAIRELRRGVYSISSLPTSLKPVEALAVHTAGRLLYHHAPARNRSYQSALEKLAQMLPDPARDIALKSAEEIRSRPSDDRALELTARAWFEGNVLAFDYISPSGSGTPRPNQLRVYFIEVSRDNLAPYAIGFERSFHHRVLTFKLSRMRNTRLLKDRYTIPENFDPRAYLSGAWGIMGASDGSVVEVRLRFSADAAYRIHEGGYPNLRVIDTLADGRLDVGVIVGADNDGFPREILPWVQSWGPRIEVLEPTSLREKWLEEAQQVVAKACSHDD